MIKFKLEEEVELPKYESTGASGFDVIAHQILKAYKGDTEITGKKLEKMQEGFNDRGYIKLRPFERILFHTGLTIAYMNQAYELQVRARSGVALKRGLLVANAPGTIDSDYRGVAGVIIYNSTPFLNKIEKGERIAQFVPSFAPKILIESDEIITITDRGVDGFGSTGNGLLGKDIRLGL